MPYRNLFLGLIAIIFLASCKVQITVPKGGSVTTESGNYECAEGDICLVDVVDFQFDETFIAVPNTGFEFIQWRKLPGGFCGAGESRFDPCHLYTAPFQVPGFQKVAEFLSRDDVFFLEPVFGPVESAGKLTARSCFNASIYNKGFHSILKYKNEDSGRPTEVESLTEGTESINGRSGVKILTNLATKRPSFVSETETYIRVDRGKKRTTTIVNNSRHGAVSITSGRFSNINYKPGRLMRFDLNKGQSYTQAYSYDVHSNGGTTVDNSRRYSESVESRTIFQGIKTITVPAGTFKTCQFKTEDAITRDDGGIEMNGPTIWIGVGNGMLIRSGAAESFKVLESGVINGNPIQ